MIAATISEIVPWSWYSFTDPGAMEGWVGLGLASKQSTAVAASDDEDDCV